MIIGDQVRLRAIEKGDLPFYAKWLNDPDVRRGLSLIMPLSMAEEEEWFATMLKRSLYERPLAIEIQPDPKKDLWVFVGNCGLFEIDWQNRLAEIGIHIGRNPVTKEVSPKRTGIEPRDCTFSRCYLINIFASLKFLFFKFRCRKSFFIYAFEINKTIFLNWNLNLT